MGKLYSPIVGSKIKLAITLNVGTIPASRFDFTCVFTTEGTEVENQVTLTKAEMQPVVGSEDTYIAVLDTTTLNPGLLQVKAIADLGDTLDPSLPPSAEREEIANYYTDIRIWEDTIPTEDAS